MPAALHRSPRVVAILAGLLLALIGTWVETTGQEPVRTLRERLEYLSYDLRLNLGLAATPTANDAILILNIDERSLQQEGRWPWPRRRLAQLIDSLRDAGAAVVAFDLVMSEPERSAADTLEALIAQQADAAAAGRYDALLALARARDGDRQLARALTGMDTVLGYVLHTARADSSGILPAPAPLTGETDALFAVPELPTHTANLPLLQQAAGHGGFITVMPDADGVIRRVPLLVRHRGELYPSLALEAARVYLFAREIGIDTAEVGSGRVVEHLSLARDQRIHTDAGAQVLVPYAGPAGSFDYLSAADLLAGDFDPARVENRIVLVGATALALADVKPTPVQNVYPGVEIHASILAGLLAGYFPYQPDWASGANVFIIIGVGSLLALVLPFLGPVWILLISALVLSGFIAGNFWLWTEHRLALATTTPTLAIAAIMLFNLSYGFLGEARRRRQLKGMFGQYVPPQLVEEMSRNPRQYHAEGESREMSVLFADIRNFTTISESLGAGELKDLLNRFFTPMTETIFHHRGTIDKYVGDMIMAFWGAPLHDARHAGHAIEGALGMLAAADRLREQFLAEGLPEINIGIGINSGVMNVGDMGSQYRRAYTVLGDAVNLASRLEGVTKYYGVRLVVGERTRELAPDFVYRTLDRVRVKGKRQGVTVHEPLCAQTELTPEMHAWLQRHDAALAAFWNQDWETAEGGFHGLAAERPQDRLYGLYLERIEQLRRRELPPDWDGVFERREK